MRGATNQKGPQRAFLNAVEAILKAEGALPVNLAFVAEGEEELGSTHFDQVLAPYVERLRQADGAFFPMNLRTPDGSAPFYQFTRNLGLPFVFGGLGHGAGAHAPDEYILIHPAKGVDAAGLAEVEKSYVDLLYALAE